MRYTPTLSLDEIKSGKTFSYDFCHYVVKLDEQIDNSNNDKAIKFKITKKNNVAVYIYGGSNRFDATKSIIQENNQPSVDQEYIVDASTGLLIVAYPTEINKETDLSFIYWTNKAVIPSEP